MGPGCSKNHLDEMVLLSTHRDGSFEHPKHMLGKNYNFTLKIFAVLISGPVLIIIDYMKLVDLLYSQCHCFYFSDFTETSHNIS